MKKLVFIGIGAAALIAGAKKLKAKGQVADGVQIDLGPRPPMPGPGPGITPIPDQQPTG